MSGPLTAFIEDSYQDTLSLMTELRDYLSDVQATPDTEKDSDKRARIVREISSMTRRLTEAMAWLLLQKAAAAGEISGDEARLRADGLLAPVDADRAATPGGPVLPIEVRGYIDRSRRLYDQVIRLREMTDTHPDE
jgi:regulator of CtrA degradation